MAARIKAVAVTTMGCTTVHAEHDGRDCSDDQCNVNPQSKYSNEWPQTSIVLHTFGVQVVPFG